MTMPNIPLVAHDELWLLPSIRLPDNYNALALPMNDFMWLKKQIRAPHIHTAPHREPEVNNKINIFENESHLRAAAPPKM